MGRLPRFDRASRPDSCLARRLMTRLACIGLVCSLTCCPFSGLAHSGERSGLTDADPQVRSAWTFSLENDMFVGDDSRYTNGIALYYGRGVFRKFTPENSPRLLHALIDRTWINSAPDRERAIVYGFFQGMQTPEDITSTELQVTDVPYAGLLGVETQLFSFSERLADRLTLTLGIVGPFSFAREAQKIVHAAIGSDDPRGWRHQIRTEPVAMLELQRGVRLLATDEDRALGPDLVFVGGGALGNLRSDLSATIVARIGNHLGTSFPAVSVAPNRQVNPAAFIDRFSWHAFGGLRVAYVANEIGADGNTFVDSHSVPLDHSELQVSAGLSWNFERWAFNLIVSDILGAETESSDPFGAFSITRRTQ